MAMAGQQESLEDAGHTSQLDGIHLYPLAFVKKHLPALCSASLVPNCVLTVIQWWGQRWMVGYQMAHHQIGAPRPPVGPGHEDFPRVYRHRGF